MKVEYRFEITATCPVDKRPDVYVCVVRASRTILVEDILAAAQQIASAAPLYQEDVARELHRLLAAEVQTVGWHSGVRTTVVCGETS